MDKPEYKYFCDNPKDLVDEIFSVVPNFGLQILRTYNKAFLSMDQDMIDLVNYKAILLSIEHWEHNLLLAYTARFREMNTGSKSCPLCHLYIEKNMSMNVIYASVCNGCPIKSSTGLDTCHGTPYYELIPVFLSVVMSNNLKCQPELIRSIKVQINFLKQLLRGNRHAK